MKRLPPSDEQLLEAARRAGLVKPEHIPAAWLARAAGVSDDTAERWLKQMPVRDEHDDAIRRALGLEPHSP